MSRKIKALAIVGGLAVVGVTAVSLITFQRNKQTDYNLIPVPLEQVETASGPETAVPDYSKFKRD